jgi:nucleotidyltransferase/DNA polymerase involved in DNA repair
VDINENNRVVEKLIHRPTASAEDFSEIIYQPITDMEGIEAFDAEQLTDLSIKAGRRYDNQKLLIHYMQPHEPYLHRAARGEEPTEVDKNPIDLLRNGYDRDEVWEAYLNNLRYVLEHVETLLENVEGDVLITADHGEILDGKISGHGEGIPHPKLKWVPWVRTEAHNQHTHDPEVELYQDSAANVDARLEALGYR